jgi:excisionase family DNA binding protein
MEIMTAGEVSELLRLSKNRVVLLARRGEIPSLMIDGRLRFDANEIEDWLKFQRQPGSAAAGADNEGPRAT